MPNNTQPHRECAICGAGPLSVEQVFRGTIRNIGSYLCETCYHLSEYGDSEDDSDYGDDNNDNYSESINNYGFHPSPIFYTGRVTRTEDPEYTIKTPCFGVELETEQPRPDYDNLRLDVVKEIFQEHVPDLVNAPWTKEDIETLELMEATDELEKMVREDLLKIAAVSMEGKGDE